MTSQPETLANAIAAHGLTIRSEFVPLSESRNASEKANPTLNWRVTLLKGPLEICTTDYSAGCAHAPAYKNPTFAKDKFFRNRAIAYECENGHRAREVYNTQFGSGGCVLPLKPISRIEPDSVNVIWSLISDSDVLDYPTFESWAETFGYETDSRKAEKTYQDCLKIALQLRASLGDSVLADLRRASEDF